MYSILCLKNAILYCDNNFVKILSLLESVNDLVVSQEDKPQTMVHKISRDTDIQLRCYEIQP